MRIPFACVAMVVVGASLVVSFISPVRAFVPVGAHSSYSSTLVMQVKVDCGSVRLGNTIRKYTCPDGYGCVGGPGGGCRKAAVPLVMSCAVCANNQKRDLTACGLSGNATQQLQCVNRVNAEFIKCQTGCRP